MNFETFLNEAVKKPTLEALLKAKGCQHPWVKKEGRVLVPNDDWAIYRGIQKPNGELVKLADNTEAYIINTRKDRKPLHTGKAIHDALDNAFIDKFGWRVRSEGVFVTGKPVVAYSFGEVYRIFPIGKTKMVFSPDVKDLTFSYTQAEGYPEKSHEEITKRLVDTKYTDDVGPDDIKSGNEIVVKCDSYIAIFDGGGGGMDEDEE